MKAWDQKDSTAHNKNSQWHFQVRKGREYKARKNKQTCKQTKLATHGKKQKEEGAHSSL